jgi:predicted Zn-dependent protease
MYNKPPEGLTAQERAYLNETAEMASTNRATYEERVNAARRLLNQGTPNPEQAYAQGSLSYQRRAREAGLRSPEDMRRTMIDATRAGASAVPAEYNRSYEATRAGLAAMPTSVPRGMESYGLEVQRDLERRQREYQASLAQAGGTLVGAFGGQRNKGLFA